MSTCPVFRCRFKLALSTALLILAASAPIHGPAHGNEYEANLEPLIGKILQEEKVPGLAIGIVKDGRLVYSRGFGVMRLGESGRPVTPGTLFHMASITKPFVATSIMQLVEQGKLDLDAPVTKYLPYF